MFSLSTEELKKKGAEITSREIEQQPELWKENLALYEGIKADIKEFLSKVEASAGGEKIRVVFTGAGTSQYVGDTLVPYLNLQGDTQKYIFQSIGTTDLVARPTEYLFEKEPTLLVSFARSGNSPESIAAVDVANKVVKNIHHLTVTCAPEGALAKRSKEEDNNFLFLAPARSNDDGFAMTGSFTCMTLTSLLIFDISSEEQKASDVQKLSNMAKEVINCENKVQEIIDQDFDRIVYLGSGSLSGLTREAQLKILELTAGQIATIFDSSMGFRHGPKSFVNDKTVVFGFINNNEYTRNYDLDILEEVKADEIAKDVIAIGQTGERNFTGTQFTFSEEQRLLPDGYLALADIVFAQTVAIMTSLKLKNTPDTPSATGTVNRVVKGVTIHDYK
ncbi:SIS domain-containing protein [Tetragenococcus halophilus]|uniref:SIS domain-containing protein n=1 Tax=Tetragenococcus halophilus TaxID=51669 RepID=UPI001F23F3D2|nr:SIS domain-containing protein [Tetragenococcus halophilus]MDN6270942.1 SIS domain-containing protein [Tetragenococcus koreensis]MCF1602469.1 SIS domain-containing protein [Tetragenococcus halophilus]MCF1676325.1 SIS domain-containing protein [Tetragenococcus halophilus]MDN6256813.1 SIS domain-containing protein [Tetragenococcus halophilus]MDN6497999.1 SIS domain-containing protein [Tetragenococcus koreensis]